MRTLSLATIVAAYVVGLYFVGCGDDPTYPILDAGPPLDVRVPIDSYVPPDVVVPEAAPPPMDASSDVVGIPCPAGDGGGCPTVTVDIPVDGGYDAMTIELTCFSRHSPVPDDIYGTCAFPCYTPEAAEACAGLNAACSQAEIQFGGPWCYR